MEAIVIPATIKDANIVSNSIIENDYLPWSVSTTYGLGARVIVTGVDVHQVWQSVHAANTGNNPLAEADLNNPLHWSLLGATNAYTMFDQYVSSQSVAENFITFTVKDLGIVNTIGLINIDADSAQVIGYDASNVEIFNQTQDLVSFSTFNSYYDYYFTPFFRKTNAVFKNMPPISNGKYTVTLSAQGTVKLGNFIAGYGYSFSAIEYESSVRPKDYSIKQQLPSGEYYFAEGRSAIEAEFQYTIENTKFDLLQRVLRDVRAKPALYIGSTLYDSTVLYGITQDAPSVLSYATHSRIRQRVEGLV